jgi:hypothetical protein
MSRHRHPRARSWRNAKDVAPLEQAFQALVEEAAGAPPPRATPLCLCFRCTGDWAAWLRRVRERYPGLDLPTVTACPPVVLVSFQRADGSGWLDAHVVDELRRLACKSATDMGQCLQG